MPQYTVQAAALKEQKEIGGNPMCVYNLTVTDPSGQQVACELLQRPDTPAPTPGLQIDGDMKPSKDPSKYPPTLKKAKKEGAGGRGGGYDSPETIARITRSHAQQMALRFFASTAKGVTIDFDADAAAVTAAVKRHLSTVKKLADWFENDVMEAAASVAPPAQPAQQQQAPPAQAAAPAAGEDDIPF